MHYLHLYFVTKTWFKQYIASNPPVISNLSNKANKYFYLDISLTYYIKEMDNLVAKVI